MILRSGALLLGVLALLPGSVWAEKRRDPLTYEEVQKIRDAADEPNERLKLYVEYARARLATLDQARSDPKVADRGVETHDRLQDFLDVYDEMNDNVEMYVGRKEDLRKPLKLVIEADNEFASKLRALRDAAGVPPREAKEYEFLLSSALETLDSSVEDHRQLLTQQLAMKHRKKDKP